MNNRNHGFKKQIELKYRKNELNTRPNEIVLWYDQQEPWFHIKTYRIEI